MASFDTAISTVLSNEGGYVDNPNDPGGATAFGISANFFPGVDPKTLTREQAEAILKENYWRYDGLTDQPLATKLLDMSVNLGLGTSVKMAQNSYNFCTAQCACHCLEEDGIWGPATEASLNGSDPNRILWRLRGLQSQYYQNLVAKNPHLEVFLKGWLARAAQ